MNGIITYEYAKSLLDKPILSFVDFQTILSYLYKKLEILLNCRLKKELVKFDLNLLNDLIVMLEIKIASNQIEDLELKYIMLGVIRKLEEEFEKVKGHS